MYPQHLPKKKEEEENVEKNKKNRRGPDSFHNDTSH
jgi:hypothetical protein